MSGHTYCDVAHGHPTFLNQLPDGRVVREVDLLWSYPFPWLVVDRWGAADQEVELAMAKVIAPPIELFASRDGSKWEQVTVDHAVVMSDKGSVGSHRSLQLIFPEPILARHLRLVTPKEPWRWEIRALLRPYQVQAAESTKAVEATTDYLPPTVHPPIRALVVGDSNAVMRYGWLRGMEQAGVTVVQNASLGSSSNAIICTRTETAPWASCDIVVLSNTVNEYIPLRDGIHDVELSRQLVRYGQAVAAQHDLPFVYVIHPHDRMWNDQREGRRAFDHVAFCRELCIDLGIPFIDGFQLMHELSTAWDRPLETLFKPRDPSHITPSIAQIMGAAIGIALRRVVADGAHLPAADGQHAHEFKTLTLPDEGSRRRLETSLVTMTMTHLVPGEPLEVPIPLGWEVVGFTNNQRRCNGSLRITGENEVVRRMDYTNYLGAEGFPTVATRSLIQAVHPKDGSVVLECVTPQRWHEADELCQATLPSAVDGPVEVEVGELVLRRQTRTMPSHRCLTPLLDLTGLVDFGDLTPRSR